MTAATFTRTVPAATLVQGQIVHGHECFRCGQPTQALEVIATWSGRTQVDLGCACGISMAADFPVGGVITLCELNADWTFVVEAAAPSADLLGLGLDAMAMAQVTGSVGSTYSDGYGSRVRAIRV